MGKRLLHYLLLFLIFACPVIINAQPVNDFQCDPIELGSLPFVPDCPPSGPGYMFGAPVNQTVTTIAATNDSLSGYISICTTATLKDVWRLSPWRNLSFI